MSYLSPQHKMQHNKRFFFWGGGGREVTSIGSRGIVSYSIDMKVVKSCLFYVTLWKGEV